MKRDEQFQIVHEVFVHLDDNFLLNRDSTFIDVGMNCGFTSLYAAQFGHVKEVHGFEPFHIPFNDALDNFSLNPALARRTAALQSSVCSHGDQRTQDLCERRAYDRSIHQRARLRYFGRYKGKECRRSSRRIRAERARQAQQAVILKLDCEGSEFPVFDALQRHDLLGEIDVYLIEWHKWWSPDRCERDLILPLLERDFIVFDQTRVFDNYAGPIRAVRRR